VGQFWAVIAVIVTLGAFSSLSNNKSNKGTSTSASLE